MEPELVRSHTQGTAPLRPSPAAASRLDPDLLRARFLEVRATTERLARPLSAEDAAVQSMPDASPTKWHLGHTTWFFETFVLRQEAAYRPHRKGYAYLFNSYYETVGAHFPRHLRGLLTRPSLDEVLAYRGFVDEAIVALLEGRGRAGSAASDDLLEVIELGVHHEQQHQELILTDIKHLFSNNPMLPAYRPPRSPAWPKVGARRSPPEFWTFSGGLVPCGHGGGQFAFDNETPEHLTYLEPYALASRLVTNGEYLAFIEDGGYDRPELWLSEGFEFFGSDEGSKAPLYWQRGPDGGPHVFTLAGLVPLDLNEPVCHVSYYEADAYARWAEARLPTEAEWENAARARSVTGNLLESGLLHPRPADDGDPQLFGDCWEWTQSAYAPYPGYRPAPGALGEYNGKFMCNQMVLRGGSCATPASHVRASYRNFLPAAARWQFTGIRLARAA